MYKYGDCGDRYTPDPGKCESKNCGVCNSEMTVERNVEGPRSLAAAMSRNWRVHDIFSCPHAEEAWHKQSKKLQEGAYWCPSKVLADMLIVESDQILESRTATIDKNLIGISMGWW